MTSRKPGKLLTIRSMEDIPTSFESEDDEREWWATHQFSAELLNSMRPQWEDISDMRPLRLRAKELTPVQFSLSISKKHLSLISRAGDSPLKARNDARLEHAAISIVFSAAAVETGLNLFLAAPVLFLEDDGLKQFFDLLVSRQAERMTLNEKLDFAWWLCPEQSASLKGRLVSLFERRSTLIHGTPLYSAPPANGRPTDASASDSGSVITVASGVTAEDVEAAFDYFEAAKAFLDRLFLGPPECPRK